MGVRGLMSYVIAHDVGTSSVKTVAVSEEGKVLASAIAGYPMQRPRPGWVEQKPEDYWAAIVKATHQIFKSRGLDKSKLLGMVFSTQAMGIIPIDKQGEVLHPNITWVDGRAEEQAKKAMRKLGGKNIFKAIVGIEITGKDVIPKLIWLKETMPEMYNNTYKFLDVNGYLKFKCTGRPVAEWSGACSYAFDVKKKDWERIFFKINGIDLEKLPELVRSTDLIGALTPEAASALNLPESIPVFGGCDDTQSAAMGTGAYKEGEGHIYLGTSAWVGISTAKNPKFKNGAVCLQSADPSKNLVVGITEMAGANVDWIIEKLYSNEKKVNGEKQIFEVINKEINEVPAGSEHLIYTPWFLGERCPVSTTTTRSTIFNLGLEHSRAHITKAQLEGIGYNLRWTIENMQKDFGFKLNKLRVTGGGSQNDLWMQMLADITQRTIEATTEPKMAGAIGASMCAFVGSGKFNDFSAIENFIKVRKVSTPNKENFEIYNKLFSDYKNLYKSLKDTYIEANGKRFA